MENIIGRQAVKIAEGVLFAVPLRLGVIVYPVREVIGSKHKHGVVKDSRLIKPVDKLLHHKLNLKLARDVCLCRGVFVRQVLYLGFVFCTHSVSAEEVVVRMAAYSHVIDVEGLVVDILTDRDLCHLMVGFRPQLCVELVAVLVREVLKTVSDPVILISEVRSPLFASVGIIVGVTVEEHRLVAE